MKLGLIKLSTVYNMKQFIVIHYHEIALKGGNRKYFEKKLCQNIEKVLNGLDYKKVERLWGRIVIELSAKSDFEKIKSKLLKVFGIAYFFKALEVNSKIESLEKSIIEIFNKEISNNKFKTFKVKTRRIDKDYPLISQEVNEKIGESILNYNQNWQVSLDNPDCILYIDILENDKAFIYFNKTKGLGGLPLSTAGRVLSLISSGFDSPVASFQIMKRGARTSFIHFHSYPQTSRASLDNVKEIIKKLNQYQLESTLYLVPFLNIQKEIHLKCNPALKVVLYRRLMIGIAEKIARKEKAKALITGESLGQVASQTLENIEVINEISTLPILRPLIGTDKEDIINKAKEISTFTISSQPYEDCCSLFVPKHPETRANIKEVVAEEKKIDIEKMISKSIEKLEKVDFSILKQA